VLHRVVTSARPCNKVGHLFWFTILALHETNDVILYIHSVHKHRGNSFRLQNYKMRLKQIRLNWINSKQVKKLILFTNVFFSWSLCIGECPSNSPFLKNNGAESTKGPSPIVFKEWRDTRTFSNLKSTHCTLLIWLIINLVAKKSLCIVSEVQREQ
jgi:hypothetical protein